MAIFYVAGDARAPASRVLAGPLLAGLAFWTALAVGYRDWSDAGWNARLAHIAARAPSRPTS